MLWARFRHNRPAHVAFWVLMLLVSIAVFGPMVVRADPNAIDLRPEMHFAPPSWSHPFGTDDAGRDWFVRALHGARVSLFVGVAATAIALVVGTLVGAVSGYRGGAIDTVLMRAVDVLLSLPLFFAVLIVQALVTPSTGHLVLVLGLTSWMRVSRVIRSDVMVVRSSEYVLAAEALGARSHERVLRHVLPNVSGPIIVAATLAVGNGILSEAALSYLGMGVPLPEASWGNMLTGGLGRLRLAPWLVLLPATLISVTVLAFNYVGEGLRSVFDPRAD